MNQFVTGYFIFTVILNHASKFLNSFRSKQVTRIYSWCEQSVCNVRMNFLLPSFSFAKIGKQVEYTHFHNFLLMMEVSDKMLADLTDIAMKQILELSLGWRYACSIALDFV